MIRRVLGNIGTFEALVILGAFVVFGTVCSWAAETSSQAVPLDSVEVRVRLATGQKTIAFSAGTAITVRSGSRAQSLPAGNYTVKASETSPTRQRFRVFGKSFMPAETGEARAFVSQWKSRGYQAEIVTFGRQFRDKAGGMVDNRSLWISMGSADTEKRAAAVKAALEGQGLWPWIMPEMVHRGTGQLVFVDGKSARVLKGQAPLEITCDQPVEIRNVEVGFWKQEQKNRTYSGTLELGVGPDGLLELFETLPCERYLAGVLPAEMPSGWPVEALKAQAVAARSEVLVSIAGKHMIEGFDFCALEHCRAYLGCRGRQSSTDAAVKSTAGVVLTAGKRIVPAVFSANCGGWTENNDTVWSGPPNPALRGTPDCPEGCAPKSVSGYGLAKWLQGTPPAYCAANKEHFRWTRRYSARELSEILNKHYGVGTVRAIRPGDRGVSGRLKSVTVVGTQKTVAISKELNIRLALGGLPSAMFMVEPEGPASKPALFRLIGGGRGHGVGLCQDGARAMAASGSSYEAILRHYFTGAGIVRLG